MTNATSVLRSLVVYGLCLPLAVILGYLLATPLEYSTFAVVGVVLFVLTIPMFLRWHHPWLIAAWNMSAIVFFLPGRPPLWIALTAISLGILILQYTINRNVKFLNVPPVTRSLLFFTIVILITMRLTGGIGLRSMGSDTYGGKRYFMLLGAILGYFAITSRQIPLKRAGLYVTLFFLGSATTAVGTLAGKVGSSMNFLFLLFPIENVAQLENQYHDFTGLSRLVGLPFMSMGVFCAMLAKFGITGILDTRRPWRLLCLLFFTIAGMYGGFRSMLILLMLAFAIVFYLEGLTRTRMLPMVILGIALSGVLVAGFASKLPLSLQRSLAFLPLDLDPMAKLSANASSEWRLQMWRELTPQIPEYLIVGKGYSFKASDAVKLQDTSAGLEGTELVGDYHNGPLSVLLTFGIFGVIGFVWFLIAGLRVVQRNYQFGEPHLQRINTFIFAFYLTRIIIFFTVFGSLYSDMATFTGLVALSISLNGGVAKPEPLPEPKVAYNRFRLHPTARKPVGV
jgi:hypothetical protein